MSSLISRGAPTLTAIIAGLQFSNSEPLFAQTQATIHVSAMVVGAKTSFQSLETGRRLALRAARPRPGFTVPGAARAEIGPATVTAIVIPVTLESGKHHPRKGSTGRIVRGDQKRGVDVMLIIAYTAN